MRNGMFELNRYSIFIVRYSLFVLSILFLPRQNPTLNINRIAKSHLVENHTSHLAALATAAMNDHFFIFQIFEIINLHCLDFSKWNQFTTEIGFFVFVR